MLRLLLIYYEPFPSGQTSHVHSVARGLDHSIFDITVILPGHFQHHIIDNFRGSVVRVVPLQLRKFLWSPGAISILVKMIRQERFDIVHVHSQEAGVIARPLAWASGAPCILYTPQTIDIRRANWQRLYTLVERLLAHCTSGVISVNKSDRQRLISWGIPSQKVVTIPNGIDLCNFDTNAHGLGVRRKLGLDHDQPLVVQVSRLSAQKDPALFIKGAERVIEKLPEVRFVLVGEGPLRADLSRRVQDRGLENQVQILGWQPDAFKLMSDANVVTLTSRWEGTPYTLLEAMAWGKPVVATAVNGCPEVVLDGKTGFLVSPGDVETWAQRVTTILTDPDLAYGLGEHGRKHVKEQFALSKMISRLEEFYQQRATISREAVISP
jgi:glycosyltransferase involved in cell wall biosynthesis